MNLHLMNDEKVVSRTIDLFEEALPGENKFIILSRRENCVFVKKNLPYVSYSEYNTPEFWNIVDNVDRYQYIIVHYLSYSAAKFIAKVNHPGFVWLIWGADLYINILSKNGFRLYDEPLIEFINSFRSAPIRTIKDIIKRNYYHKTLMKALKKLSYVSGPDYNIFVNYYPELRVSYKEFYYYPIDEIVGELSAKKHGLGNNIVVGNSASFTNNHKNILKTLSRICGAERKIITPLSYGAAKKYVVRLGNKYCPASFYPITEFMPITEYNNLLLSARTFIYGHHRQEAFGNILTALYIGGTVFLYSDNPLYEYLRRQGFILFEISELNQKIDYHLSINEKVTNRNRCVELYGMKRLMELIRMEFN